MSLTMEEKLHHRLGVEERQMFSLNTDGLIEIEGIGPRPHRQYRVRVTVDSFLKGRPPVYSRGPHVFTISAPAGYPLGRNGPVVHFESTPVAHLNIYSGGIVCVGAWTPQESLASETIRTVRLIMLDPATFNFQSAADADSVKFCRYLARSGRRCDVRLPAPLSPAQLGEGPQG